MEVGAAAGAASSAAKEILKEMRGMEGRIMSAITGKPVAAVEPEPASAVQQPEDRGPTKYVNMRAMLTFIALGAIAGAALTFATPVAAGIFGMMKAIWFVGGAATALPAIPSLGEGIALGAGALGLVGSIFGINYPVITTKVNNMFGNMLAGKSPFAPPPPNKSPAQAVAMEPQLAAITLADVEKINGKLAERENMPHAQTIAVQRNQPQPAGMGR